jgi:hypothetical protein
MYLSAADIAALAAAGFNLAAFIVTPPTPAQLDAMANAINRARGRAQVVTHLQNLGSHI